MNPQDATQEPIPTYVLVSEGTLRRRCLAELPGALALDGAAELEGPTGRPPGLVLVDPAGMSARDLVALTDRLPAEAGWRVCVVADGDAPEGAPAVRALSAGGRHALAEVRLLAEGGGGERGVLLHLQGVLEEVAKARHDLNNPLTSALAEVQILLMDVSPGPEEESLLIVQEQLRRLRDRLLATRHLRPPSRARG